MGGPTRPAEQAETPEGKVSLPVFILPKAEADLAGIRAYLLRVDAENAADLAFAFAACGCYSLAENQICVTL